MALLRHVGVVAVLGGSRVTWRSTVSPRSTWHPGTTRPVQPLDGDVLADGAGTAICGAISRTNAASHRSCALLVSSMTTRSVNVPPMSTPRRAVTALSLHRDRDKAGKMKA